MATIITSGMRAYETQILCYIQSHPKDCKSTNAARLSRVMNLQGIAQRSVAAVISDLIKRGVITRIGSKWNARFFINYTSPNCPENIKLRASQAEKTALNNFLANKKDGDTITDDGIIIHKSDAPAKKTEAKKQASKTITVPVDKDGKHFIINININI